MLFVSSVIPFYVILQALKVSDHYPVEADLNLKYSSAHTLLPSAILIVLSVLAAGGTKTLQ